MIKEIENRRSIRKFSNEEIPDEWIWEVLESGRRAPSGKNKQPWRFAVVRGKAKEEMITVFRRGIDREEQGISLLPGSRQHILGARQTAEIMEQAPVCIFVLNGEGEGMFRTMSGDELVTQAVDIQSIGAAVQNILLAAEEKGLGSLWICDIFFAHQELSQWLNRKGDLLAAVALGMPLEKPAARPRKKLEEIVWWRE